MPRMVETFSFLIRWTTVVAALACGLALTATAQALQSTEAGPPPNVVFILCDDLGYGDLGCYGQEKIRTPRIDALAQQGVRFTDYYVTQAVCSASRSALLTGCYPNRIGILGALGPASKIGIHDDETTLGEVFQARGYATTAIGKWHLGDHPQFLPRRHGFDSYFGLPYSNDMWPRHPEAGSKYPDLPLIADDKVIEQNPDQSRLTERYTQAALQFIEGNKERPFLVYLAHSMPHVPLFVGAKFRGQSAAGLYGDVIEEIDDSVGQIVDLLERLKLSEKTLVVFTSDNGPWLSYGNHAGNSGGLREGKGTSWDGGVRVPCVARWPGQIPAGTTTAAPVMCLDWFPTLTKLCGGALPSHPIDGRDLGEVLRRPAEDHALHDALFFYWGDSLEAVRSGPWKLHFPHPYRTLAGPGGQDGQPAQYRQATTELALFNLQDDPAESKNVAAEQPEVVARLTALANGIRAELGDRATGQMGQGVRPAGRLP